MKESNYRPERCQLTATGVYLFGGQRGRERVGEERERLPRREGMESTGKEGS